jgi:hypothetical protein
MSSPQRTLASSRLCAAWSLVLPQARAALEGLAHLAAPERRDVCLWPLPAEAEATTALVQLLVPGLQTDVLLFGLVEPVPHLQRWLVSTLQVRWGPVHADAQSPSKALTTPLTKVRFPSRWFFGSC